VKLIAVPATLDDRTFEQLAGEVGEAGPGRALVDARHLRWVDPYGMLGLLSLGEVLGQGGEKANFQMPESPEVVSYLTRMGFFHWAARLYEMEPVSRRAADEASDVLLEITPVTSHVDVHQIVDRVNERALTILTRQLHYPLKEAFQFSVMLSEVCQNIIEHADASGWVATQTYHWARRLGRKVVSIAVMDLGMGFHGSLGSEHAARYGERWSDASALEAAFIHGVTRFRDPGRGQGLQQIRKQVRRWDGRISIRSGSARIADIPSWSDGQRLEEGLAPFPGTQISIILPSRVPEVGEAPGVRREEME
jgi:hypothetical protein